MVPVSARNLRANVRADMWLRRASVSTLRSSPMFSTIHWSSGPRVSASQSGTALAMNCACPPSRCGGMTIRRAVVAATLAPKWSRIRCSDASMPAADPAPVRMLPSWQ